MAYVNIILPDGRVSRVLEEDADAALGAGSEQQSPEQQQADREAAYYEGRQVDTAIRSAASVGTFGITDAIAGNISPEYAKDTRKGREHNVEGHIVGSVIGGVLPGGAGGLVSTAGKGVGLAAARQVGGLVNAGTKVAPKIMGATAGARIVGGVAQGVTEGALFGYGQGVSELGLSAEPITAERVLGTLGSNVLIGAAYGGAGGTAGSLLSEGAIAGRSAVQKWATAKPRPVGKVAGEVGETFDDVSAMDGAAARVARKAELDGIESTRQAAAGGIYEEARRFDDFLGGEFVKGGDKRFARLMAKTRSAIRSGLDNPKTFARYKGQRVLDGLQTQERALTEFVDGLTGVQQAIPDALPTAPGGSTRRLRAASEVPTGPITAGPQAKLANEILAQNRALQARIGELAAPPASPRLAAIDEHIAVLAQPQVPKSFAQGIAEQAAGGALAGVGFGIAGPIGGAVGYGLGARAGGMFFAGGGGKALVGKLAEGAQRGKDAVARGAAAFATGAEKVARAAPVLATQVLRTSSFAAPTFTPARALAKSSNELVNHYKAREAELRSQTTMGPNGKIAVSSQARSDIHQRLQALWMVDPKLADLIETAAANRLGFLASKLPPRPGSQAMKFGPDKWHPGELEMRKFARYVDATENPDAIWDRLADGKMTPEDAEVMQSVYPETYADAKRQILGHLSELQETLPYRKRLMLSMFFDVSVEQSLEPDTLAILQGNFTAEPGTNGGMNPPPIKPGGLKNTPPPPTSAQRMSAP